MLDRQVFYIRCLVIDFFQLNMKDIFLKLLIMIFVRIQLGGRKFIIYLNRDFNMKNCYQIDRNVKDN